MGPELLLLRHAKSNWNSGINTDHERPLNERGRKAAPRMGQFMAEEDLIPDHILCSTAQRTRETLSGLEFAWAAHEPSHATKVEFSDAIYEAHLSDLLAAIEPHIADDHRLLVIGHNPGLQLLMHFLVRDSKHPLFDSNFPTCALAQIALNKTKGLQAGCGALLRLEHVKKLPIPSSLPPQLG